MPVKIEPSWKKALESEFNSPYFASLADFVRSEYKTKKVFPSPKQIFAAFDACPFENVRVVILGQDPYHGPGQANGLCFSVSAGIAIPPSLQNVYKEIQDDIGTRIPESGNLERWAKQGVLLLNATLTVRAHTAGSHQNKGWEEFTDAAVQKLSDERENIVFMLWGRYAQDKGSVIDREKHYVLEAAHPSPFAAHKGFFGCKHFSKANTFLKNKNLDEIEW